MSINQNEEVRLLAALCRELAKSGLIVGMSDAKPAVSVRLGGEDPRLWVSVDMTGEFFEWCRGVDERHAVADPEGAAQVIADRVRCSAGRDR
jgi:hypothetical protein